MVSSAARRSSVPVRRSLKKRIRKFLRFDVKMFLDSAGLRRKVAEFRGKETVFGQGDAAKSVMYIQEGGVKLSVVNETGKEAVVAILDRAIFWRRVPGGPVHLHGDGDHDCTYYHAGH